MQVSQMVDDLKQHLEHAGELVASHIPVLVEWAAKAESNPLVSAALSTTLTPTGQAIVTDLLQRLEQHESEAEAARQQAAADAAAAAAQSAMAPADPAAPEPDAAPAQM